MVAWMAVWALLVGPVTLVSGSKVSTRNLVARAVGVSGNNVKACAERHSRRRMIGAPLISLLSLGVNKMAFSGEGPLDQAPVVKKFQKLDSGTQIADLTIGKGEEIREGSRVLIDYVFRRADGYFVESTENKEPFGFVVGNRGAISGLDEGVRGMRQGGTRRIVVPIQNSFTCGLDADCPGPIPKEFGTKRQVERQMRRNDPYNYFFFEVSAVSVKNP
mmetsp:Transcript_16344/g.24617  ORF Transcript_16344/g.24617 Transcript_16344/m.24617 type:complete len:218 (+) Transcript_16344:127-780(+)|eukprot:CAMPEP_0167760626 /NCGR_PEP_ID=MMETSP0110_2-20121227/11688_1 /TAXON_ID=629695 /ORGANISM="Gymnochlora sp., Strain CCMP2014" /LENGTH=217 /DNA_ID=CAMNT_0007647153 /DNA_START=103 /DNA_END=756 /DNA_ORIENTATION=+